MELIAIGGDLRYAYMIRKALGAGWKAGAIGLERAGLEGVPKCDWRDIEEAEAIVMPNPFGKGPLLPFAQEAFTLETLTEHLRAGTALILFGPGEIPEAIRARHRIVLLSRDEALTLDLARQTADGAISAAGLALVREWHSCPVLIVGYGRIARSLHLILNGYGAHVTVAARREEARVKARQAGANAVDLLEMRALLPVQQVIFSTPPERVLGACELSLVKKNALVVDLSSPPYGVDLEDALSRGLIAWREPALPGRYCPQSAGVAMFNAVIRAMKGDE